MSSRRASKRARPSEPEEQEQEQQQQKPEQLERRASRRLADAAAPPPPLAAAITDDDEAFFATERASDPTGFAGLTSEGEDDGVDDGAVEQPPPAGPPPRRRARGGEQPPPPQQQQQQQEEQQSRGRKKVKARRRSPSAPSSVRATAAAAAAAPLAAAAAALPPQAPAPPPPVHRKKLSPLALTLYVRWWAPDGLKTRVHEIPLRSVGSADDLRGLPRELVRRLFGVPPSLPADAPIAHRLPPHASGPDFYRFTPAGGREFLPAPGPIAAFEVRLVVAAGGWEHTIADRGGGGLGGPGDVVVAVTDFESPPVDTGAAAGLPRALLPMLRLPLIAYPLVCVRRSFLDRVERMLTAGALGGQALAAAPAPGRDFVPPGGAQPPPLPGADHPGAGAAGVGGAVAFCADAVAVFDGRCAAGVAASLGRPDGGRGLGSDAATARERAAAAPIVPL